MPSVASSAACPRSSKARVCVEAVTWMCRIDVGALAGLGPAVWGARPDGRGGTMRVDLNAKVRTTDGHEAGKIHRVLVDPETERITGFVVSTRRLLGRDVIVGEDMFAGVSPDGETITLNLTKKELDNQPSVEEDDFVTPPAGWSGPTPVYAIPPDTFLSPS